MRACCTRALSLILLLCMLSPFQSIANDRSIALYNRDVSVAISNEIQWNGGRYYMAVEDLSKVDITVYIYNDGSINMSAKSVYTEGHLSARADSNIVYINYNAMIYSKAVIQANNKSYISLELISMAFSKIYEMDEENGVIRLWTKWNAAETVFGKVSLPDGISAPAGGLEVKILVDDSIPETTSSSGSVIPAIGWPGFNGWGLDTISEPSANWGKVTRSKTIVIPEGQNSVDYLIEIYKPKQGNIKIGYLVDDDRFYGKGKEPYDLNNSDRPHDIGMYLSHKNAISGKITIPEKPSQDTPYRVIVQNDIYTTVAEGAIPAGQSWSDYAVHAVNNTSYRIFVVFPDRQYTRERKDCIRVPINGDVTDIDFNPVRTQKIHGEITLPEGFQLDASFEAEVTMQSADKPEYYFLDTQIVKISAERTTFDLISDIPVQTAIVYYNLSQPQTGLYQYGHYHPDGSVVNANYAQRLDMTGGNVDGIVMPMIGTEEFVVNVHLPEDIVAQSEIGGNILAYGRYTYPMPYESGSIGDLNEPDVYAVGLESFSIKENGTSGTAILNLPVQRDMTFTFKATLNYGYEGVYKTAYYKKDGVTSQEEMADSLTQDDGKADIWMVRLNTISGRMVTDASNVQFLVYAIPQKDLNQRADARSALFLCKAYTDKAYQFAISVPSDVEHYIIAYKTDDALHYYAGDNSITDDIGQAEIVTVCGDMDNIGLLYEGFNPPLPIIINSDYSNMYYDTDVNFSISNISEFPLDNITVNACFYDRANRLIAVKQNSGISLAAGAADSLTLNVYEERQICVMAKIMVWGGNLRPLAAVYLLNRSGDGMTVFVDDRSVYKQMETMPFVQNGYVWVPYRFVSEQLGLNMEYNSEQEIIEYGRGDQSIVLQLDSDTAVVNGETVAIDAAPRKIANRIYVPLGTIAEYFGFSVELSRDNDFLDIYTNY